MPIPELTDKLLNVQDIGDTPDTSKADTGQCCSSYTCEWCHSMPQINLWPDINEVLSAYTFRLWTCGFYMLSF